MNGFPGSNRFPIRVTPGNKLKDGRRRGLIGATQGENDAGMIFPGDDDQPAGDLVPLQCLVQELGLSLQRSRIAFGMKQQKRRSAWRDTGNGRRFAQPVAR